MTDLPASRLAARPATKVTPHHAMNLWRLELLRLFRTPRAVALGAVFVVLGLIEPLATKYQSQIINRVGNGVHIILPPATPAQGISSYLGETNGIGLILVVVIAAGAFTFDSHHGLAIFLRTRATSLWQLITPRFVVNSVAACTGYLPGTLAAWYETDLLLGPLPAGKMFAGLICAFVYWILVVSLTCAVASVVKGTLGTVGLTVVVLLVLPIAGVVKAVHNWLPTTLADAPAELLGGPHLSNYLPSLGVSVAASAALLTVAVLGLRSREV